MTFSESSASEGSGQSYTPFKDIGKASLAFGALTGKQPL